MVIDAVRGAPTVAPSRTAYFYSRGRAQAPALRSVSDTSESPRLTVKQWQLLRSRICPVQKNWETPLIMKRVIAPPKWTSSRSPKKTTTAPNEVPTHATTSAGQQGTETDPMECSIQDTTLLETKEQAREVNTAGTSKSKKRKSNKRLTRRGISMREEIFSKIRWTRWFISGPADRSITPT